MSPGVGTVGRMSLATVLVVSDTHLSARAARSATHWDAVVDHVAAGAPDLVVHAGDISTDGVAEHDDLGFARAHLDRLAVPLAVVPGNHDVGDGAGWAHEEGAVIGASTLDRYGAAFGHDHFSVALGSWRLLGVDAQLFGSGEPAEEAQWAWLAAEVAALPAATRVGVVTHKPLVPAPGDRDRPERYVPEASRRRLLDLFAPVDLRLVVSGHVHQALVHDTGPVRHVWAPSTWAALPDRLQARLGDKRVGATGLVLADDGTVEVVDVRLPGVDDVVLGDDIPSPFGELPVIDPAQPGIAGTEHASSA